MNPGGVLYTYHSAAAENVSRWKHTNVLLKLRARLFIVLGVDERKHFYHTRIHPGLLPRTPQLCRFFCPKIIFPTPQILRACAGGAEGTEHFRSLSLFL